MTRDLLRSLPGVDAWLSSEQGATLCAEFSREEVVVVMRSHLARIRGQLQNGGTQLPVLTGDDYTNLLRADLLERRSSSLKPVINATGIVIHTNLGRAPLADEAIEAMTAVSRGYSNLEFELESGERGSRNSHAAGLISELTGAEAALVVNNCAAAVLFVLHAFAGSGEVVVSRGELIEIGGSFRMPDVIAASGARMVEVGTTNRTTARDYAAALSGDTRVLLTSHPSNYRIVGFTTSAKPRELKALANDNDLILVQDLGSGSLCKLDHLDANEPTVADCLAEGADIVTFSGDKLLGGPQAGIIVGRAELIDRLRRHPFARALRIDKLSLAALIATLKLYAPPNDPFDRIPVLRMIGETATEIGRRAARIAEELAAIDRATVSIVDGVSFAGGGALPMNEIPTKVIRLEVGGLTAAEVAAALRTANPPVIGRISKNAVTLDLRTVQPGQTDSLAGIIRDALA